MLISTSRSFDAGDACVTFVITFGEAATEVLMTLLSYLSINILMYSCICSIAYTVEEFELSRHTRCKLLLLEGMFGQDDNTKLDGFSQR